MSQLFENRVKRMVKAGKRSSGVRSFFMGTFLTGAQRSLQPHAL